MDGVEDRDSSIRSLYTEDATVINNIEINARTVSRLGGEGGCKGGGVLRSDRNPMMRGPVGDYSSYRPTQQEYREVVDSKNIVTDAISAFVSGKNTNDTSQLVRGFLHESRKKLVRKFD